MSAQRPSRAETRSASSPQSDSATAPDAASILASIGDVIYQWDLSSDRLICGPNALQRLGIADIEDIATGRRFADQVAAESPSSRYDAIVATNEQDIGQGVAYQIVYGLRNAPISPRERAEITWIEDTGRWFAGPDGRPARAEGIMRVITQRYQAEQQLNYLSQFDALTGALQRAPFIDHTAARLGECVRKGGTFAVLLAGLDNLFAFNRTFGYDVGDELIAAVSQRVRAYMRSSDRLARYAGNKFALFLEDCTAGQMEVAARRLLTAVEDGPFSTSAGLISANLHIGGVVAPEHGRMVQAVLRHAEEALESARQSPNDRFVAYTPSLVREDARMKIMQVSDEIVAALNEGRIVLALQPVVVAKTGKTAFYEALLRIGGDDGQLVTPSAILAVAEKTGLVQLIDQRMLELAAAQLARDPALWLSLNASGMSVLDPQWPDRLQAICQLYPDIAPRLTIEITETCAMSDMSATRQAVAAMKACGVKVAMDDFGAGHTSFRNLRSLQIDLLKIDGAFVENLSRCEDDRAFVRTLVDLARHLGIPTVAEWVEDAESAAILTDWGVDYLQGHYFGAAQCVADSEAPRLAGQASDALRAG